MYRFHTSEKHEGDLPSQIPFSHVWTGFKENTTAHGIPHVSNAKGPIKVVFWSLITLACLGGLILNAYILFEKFFRYDVNVVVKIKHDPKLVFPAITVCNNNPIRRSLLDHNPTISEIFQDVAATNRKKRAAKRNPEESSEGSVHGQGKVTSPTVTSEEPANRQGKVTSPTVTSEEIAHGQGIVTSPPVTSEELAHGQGIVTSPPVTPVMSEELVNGQGIVTSPPVTPVMSDERVHGQEKVTSLPEEPEEPINAHEKVESQDISVTSARQKTLQRTNLREDEREIRPNYLLKEEVYAALAILPFDAKSHLGNQRYDFILDCEYQGYSCNVTRDFTDIFSNKYGNCFTYNWGVDNITAPVTSFRPGPQHGLSMIFNIDQLEYVGDLAESAGLRVVIHPPATMPFPEDEGISVSPGQLTYVGVKLMDMTRKGGKYGDCYDINVKDHTRNVYQELYHVHYSPKTCYRTCYQYHMLTKCGCADSGFPFSGRAFHRFHNISACDARNNYERYCQEDIMDLYVQDELTCDCPMPCKEVTYMTSISSALWPSEEHELTLIPSLEEYVDSERFLQLKYESDADKYVKNLAKVVIYYQEFNYESIEERPAYIIGTFVSDLGGILGLYIGFSVMTILEFGELLSDFLALVILKILSKHPRPIHVKPVP